MASNNLVLNSGDLDGPDCLYITESLTYMDVGTSTIAIVPVNGGLTLDIRLNDINIDISSNYAAACINGSSDVTIHADSLHVTGMLNFANAGTDFRHHAAEQQRRFPKPQHRRDRPARRRARLVQLDRHDSNT